MERPIKKTCGVCGESPTTNQIYFSRDFSEREREKYGATQAELDMLFCEACGDRVFKHLKRMFTLRDLGLSRPPSERNPGKW